MAKLMLTNRGDKKSPSWQYRFYTAKVGGVRKSISKGGFATKTEAEKAGLKAMQEYERSGKAFNKAEMSVSDFLDYWLENYCYVNLADNTVSSYKNIINKHIKPRIGKYKLLSVDVITLQKAINDLYVEGNLSGNYIKSILKVMKGAFDYAAYTLQLIPYNVAQPVKMPKLAPNKEKVSILSKEQIEAVLDRFRGSAYQYYPLLIGYYTGMRVGEVYGLTWNDIDLENGIIHVRQQVKVKDKDAVSGRKPQKGKAIQRWYLGALKTKSSYRTIRIGDELTSALKKYKALQEQQKEEYGEYYIRHYLREEKLINGRTEYRILAQSEEAGSCAYPMVDLVCVKDNGEFRGTTPMVYVGKVARDELGIPDFHFHMLRHTHATVLVSSSDELQIKDISERLGHSSISTTMNTYVENTDDMRTKSMEIFEKIGKLNVAHRNDRLYNIWKATKNKCNGVAYYKDKGIKFYSEWYDYEVFEAWALSHGYEDDLSLVRLDKSADYDPSNCYWIDTQNKEAKGNHVWSDGIHVKSYSIRFLCNSWQYRIRTKTETGETKEISKLGFETEADAVRAAEEVLAGLFKNSARTILKTV